ncbi:hypothetical protein J6590_035786 [Homalodisca vitripennis]|nr:hypothetical protein J6590_095154 [Homalodisca vitripennis]KAG8321934.1 hypothetical protein J6590_035786 [Homalodisca vitripennis]
MRASVFLQGGSMDKVGVVVVLLSTTTLYSLLASKEELSKPLFLFRDLCATGSRFQLTKPLILFNRLMPVELTFLDQYNPHSTAVHSCRVYRLNFMSGLNDRPHFLNNFYDQIYICSPFLKLPKNVNSASYNKEQPGIIRNGFTHWHKRPTQIPTVASMSHDLIKNLRFLTSAEATHRHKEFTQPTNNKRFKVSPQMMGTPNDILEAADKSSENLS